MLPTLSQHLFQLAYELVLADGKISRFLKNLIRLVCRKNIHRVRELDHIKAAPGNS